MGLGTFTVGGANYWGTNSPFSLLHLIGRNGAFIQQASYRPWMHTGITCTDNQNLSYFGLLETKKDGFISSIYFCHLFLNTTLNLHKLLHKKFVLKQFCIF